MFPSGEYRWLTVTSPDGPEGVELLLEPMAFPPAREYQKALFAAGIPATAFVTSDIQGDVERLKSAGVVFRGEPLDMGTVMAVAFEDTCGNLTSWSSPRSCRPSATRARYAGRRRVSVAAHVQRARPAPVSEPMPRASLCRLGPGIGDHGDRRTLLHLH